MARKAGKSKYYTGKSKGSKASVEGEGNTNVTRGDEGSIKTPDESVNNGNITIDISNPGDITAGLAAAMSLTAESDNKPESAGEEGSAVSAADNTAISAETDDQGAVNPVLAENAAENRSSDIIKPETAVEAESASSVNAAEGSIATENSSDEHSHKASGRKKKKKRSYYLMLFTDSETGGIKQMGINQKTAEIFLGMGALLVVIILILVICLSLSRKQNGSLKDANESLMADIDSLESQISVKDETIATQGSKITALSNTVNEKVADEKQHEKEDKDNHMPAGFPLSASTSYSEPDENLVITFKAEEGTSVIASGDGVVMQVIADPVYEHCIVIDHENGYSSVYRNAGDPMVKEGDKVTRGQILFLTGANNKEVAYNIYKDKEAVNPLDIMKIDG